MLYKHDILHRIISRSTPNTSGCIEYRAGQCKHPYGLISVTINKIRKSIPAHRAMWMATYECFDLPRHIQIRHKCDNPCCVNISHLEIGSAKDNSNDCIKRGRRATVYKLHTRLRKLTDEQVADIRDGEEKPSHCCQKYGVTAGYVSKLRNLKAKALVK